MIQEKNFFEHPYVGRYIYALFSHSDNALAQSVRPQKNHGSCIWSIPCCLLRGTAVLHGKELCEGLKHGTRARDCFFFLRKNERTRYSVEKAIAAEGKRWVGVLIEEAWRVFLLMRHRSSVSRKTKVCCCDRGEQGATAHFSKVKSSAIHRTFSEGEVAVKLQTPSDKIYQQWVVLWMDNWDNKEFTTSHDKNDKTLNATAMAVLLLRDAPRYCHGHPSLKELERRVSIVARMLGKTQGTFVRILCDLGLASTRLVVRNIRAPLDIIGEVPARRPLWRPVCLSKEKILTASV